MKKIIVLLIAIMACASLLMACDSETETTASSDTKAEYILELSGTLEESGVLSYAGYDMNVYEDQASNPCGDCEYQPVSVLKGYTAEQVTEAIIEAIERADDLWEVESSTDTSVTLIEKEAGTCEEPDDPEAPEGLTITGTYVKE